MKTTRELTNVLALLDFKDRLRVLRFTLRMWARFALPRIFSARTFCALVTKNRLLPLRIREAAADRLLIELLKAVGKGE